MSKSTINDIIVTAKDGLLYVGGKIVELPKADLLAYAAGFTCAEQYVKYLEKQQAIERKN